MNIPLPPHKEGKTSRQNRLGAALRENLRKRKSQEQRREELKEVSPKADLKTPSPCDTKSS
jgi:hypothetical protein